MPIVVSEKEVYLQFTGAEPLVELPLKYKPLLYKLILKLPKYEPLKGVIENKLSGE